MNLASKPVHGRGGNGQGDWNDGSVLLPTEPYIHTAKCTGCREMFLALCSGTESSLISSQPVSGNTGETWAVTHLRQFVMHGRPFVTCWSVRKAQWAPWWPGCAGDKLTCFLHHKEPLMIHHPGNFIFKNSPVGLAERWTPGDYA